jgi:hypothetical protein
MAKTEKTNVKQHQKITPEIPQQRNAQEDARVEFEQRFDFFMTQFRSVCEEAEVPIAIAIVVDAKNPTTPFIYNHGHIYDQASVLASILRDLKRKIMEEISA